MRSDGFLAVLAGACLFGGCAVAPRPAAAEKIPDGWFASADEVCDRIRQAGSAADEPALLALEIPESLWVASTWLASEARAVARDPAHERSSREFARWLHEANSGKGRRRLIQALRDGPDSSRGCPTFETHPAVAGPLELFSFAEDAEGIRLAGSLARMGQAWRVHSFAEAGAKR